MTREEINRIREKTGTLPGVREIRLQFAKRGIGGRRERASLSPRYCGLLFSGLLEFGFEGGEEVGKGGGSAEVVEPGVVEELVDGREGANGESFLDELERFGETAKDGIEAGKGIVGAGAAKMARTSDFLLGIHIELIHKVSVEGVMREVDEANTPVKPGLIALFILTDRKAVEVNGFFVKLRLAGDVTELNVGKSDAMVNAGKVGIDEKDMGKDLNGARKGTLFLGEVAKPFEGAGIFKEPFGMMKNSVLVVLKEELEEREGLLKRGEIVEHFAELGEAAGSVEEKGRTGGLEIKGAGEETIGSLDEVVVVGEVGVVFVGETKGMPELGVGPVNGEAVLELLDGHFIIVGLFIVAAHGGEAETVGVPEVGIVGKGFGGLEHFLLGFDEEVEAGGDHAEEGKAFDPLGDDGGIVGIELGGAGAFFNAEAEELGVAVVAARFAEELPPTEPHFGIARRHFRGGGVGVGCLGNIALIEGVDIELRVSFGKGHPAVEIEGRGLDRFLEIFDRLDVEARIVDEEPHLKVGFAAVIPKFGGRVGLMLGGGLEGFNGEADVERFARVLGDLRPGDSIVPIELGEKLGGLPLG